MLNELRGAESILIADDEPVVLSLTKLILLKYGYKVLVATNGQEALQVLRSAGPVDLLLTDVVMPVMTGPELAHQMKQELADLRCVFMSGYDHEQIHKHGVGCDYLRKPFTPEMLLRKVRQTLDFVRA
jgi:two-component system cell cycle sensor histidine kinase/response regulator CckA